MSDPEVPLTKEEAERLAEEDENRLRKKVRSFSPDEFAMMAASWNRSAGKDISVLAMCPPHHLLRAIEANCAYFHPAYKRTLDYNGFAACINVLHESEDQYVRHVLRPDGDLFDFIQFLFRTQFELQRTAWVVPFGRAARIYCDPKAVPNCTTAFMDAHGLTPSEWFQICNVIYATTGLTGAMGFDRNFLNQLSELGISRIATEHFLRETSAAPQWIGREYLRLRQIGQSEAARSSLLWSQLKPASYDKPLMHFGDRWLAPNPELQLRLLHEGLYLRLVAFENPAITQEIGEQYERYVGGMLAMLPKVTQVLAGKELQVSTGKSCDFAVMTDGVCLLIECKAVMLNTELVTSNAVLKSSPVGGVSEGYVQILETAERIRQGGYKHLGVPPESHCIGVVTTLGRIPGANSERFWDYTTKALGSQKIDLSRFETAFSTRPQVLDVSAFELLVIARQLGPHSLPEIIHQKLSMPYSKVGDWQEFLNGLVRGRSVDDLSYWRNDYDRLVAPLLQPPR